MMHLDTHTAVFVSTVITAVTSLALLLFSLSKRENWLFLWAALASGSLAGAQMLVFLRGRISDFFSIIVANGLALLCLIAFFEVIRRLRAIRSKERFVGPCLLVIQIGFFLWYTYREPNFLARSIVIISALSIMNICILKLLLIHAPKDQRVPYMFAALPFLVGLLGPALRIWTFFFGTGWGEYSYDSPAFALSVTHYGTQAVWMTLSLVFIVSNELRSQIAEMALTDPLTGALNRRALYDAATREMSRAKRSGASLSVIMTDIDHFKYINDSYGHQAGDAILAHTVDVYQKILRTEDILARYGGEEFVIVVPGSDLNEALSVAERLRIACKENTLIFENHSIPITSSFGVTSCVDNTMTYEALVKEADNALYRAKEEGRDRVVSLH